jgi:hypothetical protein
MRSNRVGFAAASAAPVLVAATATAAGTAAAAGTVGARRALFLEEDGDLLRFDVDDVDDVVVDDATESARTRFFLFDGGLMANICDSAEPTQDFKRGRNRIKLR